MSTVDYGDIQGLVRFAYKYMTEACYFLLRVRDAEAARAWCAAAPVTTAVPQKPAPPVALQLAFTAGGLRALEVPEHVIAGFSAEFLSGMAGEENRSRRLGDIGANAPEYWSWGAAVKPPEVLAMLFAEPGKLAAWEQSVTGNGWDAAFEVLNRLTTSDLGGREPFGFTDGISQPDPDWGRTRETGGDQLDYTNLAALGEFLLGYPNEYGKYTERPLLDPSEEYSEALPPAEDSPGRRDLGRNGTYVVMRQLDQDVRGFWQFLYRKEADAAGREGVAQAMVGRTRDGAPLVPLSAAPIEGVKDKPGEPANSFTYDDDPSGVRCPLGAHIRRANPRNADLPGHPSGLLSRTLKKLGAGGSAFRGDIMASTRFHRILRRGREYGPGLSPNDALEPAPPGDPPRGLQFICLNGNIARQFEFVQNAWLMSTKFNGLTEESDPPLGNRAPVGDCSTTGDFSIPQPNGLRRVITGMPQFITVRGGAYFFMPGVRALRYFARRKE